MRLMCFSTALECRMLFGSVPNAFGWVQVFRPAVKHSTQTPALAAEVSFAFALP